MINTVLTQIDLNGQLIDVNKEIKEKNTVKVVYSTALFEMSVGTKARKELDILQSKSDTDGVMNWVAAHLKLIAKLPQAQQGAEYERAIQIFNKVVWAEKLWIPPAAGTQSSISKP